MKQSWEIKRIEDCFKLKSGDGLTSKNMSEDGTFPVFGGNGIAGLHNDFNLSGSNVIIGRVGALCGNVRHMNEKIWLTDNAFKIVDFKYDFDHSFLTYLLNFKNLREYARQAAQPVISNSSLKDVILEFPKSIPEQQRIVAILDEAFAAIANAKANAEQNLKNAKELFESYLQGVFENKGGDWVKDTLEKLLEKGWIVSHLDGNHGGDYPKREEFKNEGVPYISANCLRGTNIDFSLAKHLSTEKAATFRKGVAINNDVLFAHNATVGPVAILKTEEEKVILGTSLTYYRCNTEYILPEYLANYMRSKEFKQQYEIIMRQSTRNQVPITKQREFYHIIPPIDFQRQIVINLEQLLEQSQKLEAIYQQKINDLEELKKSILQRAFAGELKTEKAMAL